MKKIAFASLNIRWRLWLLGAAGLLAVYSVAGFWLVPRLIQQQIPRLGQTGLARQATVGEVRFNPYTLRLELQDLGLAEADGAPLLTIGAVVVDLKWESLVRRAWTLAEIRLTAPSVYLTIAANGNFNIARLMAAWDGPAQDTRATPALPRLIIEHLALEQGRVALRDDQAGYRNQLSPINFALAGFSTLPERSSDYTFSATSAHGGTLRWKGSASVNPIRGSGELVLENVSLPELAVYLPPAAGVRVESGRLSATLPYRFAYAAGKFDAGLDQARLALQHPGLAFSRADPPLKVGAGQAALQLQLAIEQAATGSELKIKGAAFTLSELALSSGAQTPLRLARLGFTDGALDLAARRASLGQLQADGGQLQLTRDKEGQLNVLRLLSAFSPTDQKSPPPGAAPWKASIAKVAVTQFGADIEDQGSGIQVHAQDLTLNLEGVSTDLTQAVRFDAGLAVREGGALSAQGSVVPAGLALQSELRVQQLALAPLQPLLDQYLKLKIAGGSVSAQGKLTSGQEDRQKAALRYVGGITVAGLALTEENGDLFAGWKSVGTSRLTASLKPNRLNIPELRIVEPSAKLHIDEDRTLNAAHLRVRPATAEPAAPVEPAPAQTPAAATAPAAAAEPFPVRIGRISLHKGKLDFADLSLLPPFAAKIHELKGAVNGLSSQRDVRSRIEMDGRVDEFGLARIQGELNPFAVSNNTQVNAVFKNVDMVPSSPYTARFTGYKLAEGKISLDLEYKVRDGQLEGNNQIVMDRLTLGERVDSPDALNLPVELAIAILKDSEGRIDVDLPVSGNTRDPKFSYGGLIWQAVGNFIGKIVTAPFRALGGLLGVGGEEAGAIHFDPGSARLLPPEREKLKQVAQMLAQRAQLRLSVPGHYSEAVDGAALRARAVRLAVTRRAGSPLEAGEEPGPANLADRAVRAALRDLYAERFGTAELEQQKKLAEQAEAAAQPGDKLPMWRRVGKLMQGEPQVADARPFYGKLQERLEQTEPLAAEALSSLGAQRASVILEALKADGVDPQSATAAAPEGISGEAGKPVPLKLGLAAK